MNDVHVPFERMGANCIPPRCYRVNTATQPFRSFATCQHRALTVGRVTRKVLLIKISKHHFAIVQAVPAQASNRLSHNAKKSQLAVNTAKPIYAAAGSINEIEQTDRSGVS